MVGERATPRGDGATVRALLRSEFALVEITVVDSGNGPALRLRDVETGRSIVLDPLELEALTRCKHADFGPLVAADADEPDA